MCSVCLADGFLRNTPTRFSFLSGQYCGRKSLIAPGVSLGLQANTNRSISPALESESRRDARATAGDRATAAVQVRGLVSLFPAKLLRARLQGHQVNCVRRATALQSKRSRASTGWSDTCGARALHPLPDSASCAERSARLKQIDAFRRCRREGLSATMPRYWARRTRRPDRGRPGSAGSPLAMT